MKNYIMFVTYVLIVATLSLIPGSGESYAHLDKIGHFIMYAVMSAAVFPVFHSKQTRLFAVIFCILLGIILEGLQTFIPGRYCSLADAIADILGVIAGVLLYRLYQDRYGR